MKHLVRYTMSENYVNNSSDYHYHTTKVYTEIVDGSIEKFLTNLMTPPDGTHTTRDLTVDYIYDIKD